MNPKMIELCRDPLFQLNLSIWLAQPQAPKHFYVYPLFYESGLNIYSLGPLLPLPPDIRLAVSEDLDCQAGASPDLLLESKTLRKFCVLECKATSFSHNSSTAPQARTLLLIAGPIISEVLGLGKRGENESLLCYLSSSNQIEKLESTLKILSQEITRLKLEPGQHGCFGLRPEQSEIVLEYSKQVKDSLGLTEDSPVKIITLEEDTDPRPLYFIPYDPNVEQTTEEQALSRRTLYERILSYIISKIGGSVIPSSITLTIEEALNAATFEIYSIWDDNNAKKNLRRLVKDFFVSLKNSLTESIKECMNFESRKGWIFHLKDKTTHEELRKQISKFKPETLDLSKRFEPTFFDEDDT